LLGLLQESLEGDMDGLFEREFNRWLAGSIRGRFGWTLLTRWIWRR
jgi:hypothetical protein